MTLQSSNIHESLSPSDKKMFMLFDGAIAGGLRSLYEERLDVCPLMVLKDGVFDGVSALGPMIADFGASIVLKELWAKNHPLVARASVFFKIVDTISAFKPHFSLQQIFQDSVSLAQRARNSLSDDLPSGSVSAVSLAPAHADAEPG